MLDKKYNAKEKEEKWLSLWKNEKIYEFKEDKREVFSIDTPPPTVNGKIHIGHVFSYSQSEMLARYKRLKGFNVFYPFGFDDNGLPSERLVEKEEKKKAHQIGREAFRELCYKSTNKYEEEFKELFSRLGVSCDWNLLYRTVSKESIKKSQLSFLDLVKKGYVYHKEAPALYCNECITSIAQAELEAKTQKTIFNYIKFKVKETSEEIIIATTRPELLPAITAIFVNPNNEKTKHLIGKSAIVPIIEREVKIIADEQVEMDKGSGIVMCCTFGDQLDIYWWKKYNLELRNIFTNYGTIKQGIKGYENLKIKDAREKIIKDLKDQGLIVKQEEIEHEVQTHERCQKEVEYVVMNQWFIDTTSHKEEFLKLGEEINWYPKHMKNRYDEWVKNVAWDWCISRQRYFGVPFPLWYDKNTHKVIFAKEEDLPVNPLVDMPRKEELEKLNVTEVVPEYDVMDTWATSSITPMINMRYGEENNFENILSPMSLRTNASEIIRTWDFYTIVKSFYHFNRIPWKNVMISGFAMANKLEKISKSKGNSKHEPMELISQYSADVLRYWAASGRLGSDIVYSEDTLLRGKKLINKLYNVAKFIELQLQNFNESERNAVILNKFDYTKLEFFDKWIILKLNNVENQFYKYLDSFEVGLGLNLIEKFFWDFCDNYIEIVKHRLYRPEEFGEEKTKSAQYAIYIILYKLIQMFSIYFPFISEELYQELYLKDINKKSIHITNFEDIDINTSLNKLRESKENKEYDIENLGDIIVEILSIVRGEKTKNETSLKTPVKIFDIRLKKKLYDMLNLALIDFKATLFIQNISMNILDEDNEKEYILDKLELELDKD